MRLFVILFFVVASLAVAQETRGRLNAGLPDWLTLRIENRLRYEFDGDQLVDDRNDDGVLLNRLHLTAGVRVNRFLRFEAQGQDARVADVRTDIPRPNFTDRMDLRQGFVVVGDEKDGFWDVKVGRQELVFGSERLLGINWWANLPRTWDAAKLALHRGGNRIDFFASSVVRVDPDDFDTPADGFNVHGAYAHLDVIPGHVFEPHVLWRTRPSGVDELGRVGDSDIYTSGFLLGSDFDSPWEYRVEADWQTGDFVGDKQRAFMGMARVDYSFKGRTLSPVVGLEYTYASGDKEQGDGKSGRFDQILARAHRIWGIVDHVGGRNSRILNHTTTLKVCAKCSLRTDYFAYWLASRTDGLYRHNGAPLIAVPEGGAQSTFVGHELDVQFTYTANAYARFGGGVGRMFRGGFLKETTPGGSPNLAFIFAELKAF